MSESYHKMIHHTCFCGSIFPSPIAPPQQLLRRARVKKEGVATLKKLGENLHILSHNLNRLHKRIVTHFFIIVITEMIGNDFRQTVQVFFETLLKLWPKFFQPEYQDRLASTMKYVDGKLTPWNGSEWLTISCQFVCSEFNSCMSISFVELCRAVL